MRELSEYPVDSLVNIGNVLIQRRVSPSQHIILQGVGVHCETQAVALLDEFRRRCQIKCLIIVLEEPVGFRAHTMCHLGYLSQIVGHQGVAIEH